jgi:curved DNA-binding protein CbpA
MNPFPGGRLFKRYRHKAEFNVEIDGSTFRASTVDFSLSGLCIFIEGSPPLAVSSRITIKIGEMDMDIQANVVWVQKTESNLLIGLKKMSISGLLKHFSLSDILLDLQRSDMTGTLEMRHDPTCKQIFVKNGTIVSAASNHTEDRIEEILLRSNKITNDTYHQVADLSINTRKTPVKALVDFGYIVPHDLFMAVKRQSEDIILSLFQWEAGQVSFIEGPLPPEAGTLKLSAANLIFHGIKSINKPEYFKAVCPPPDTVLYYSEEPINLFQDIRITEQDQYVLSLIDSKVTIKEMMAVSSLGELMTMKIICALLGTRMIVPIGKGHIPEQSIIRMMREPRENIDEAFVTKVEDIHRRLGSIDYYGILGIGHKASPEEVKKAFYKYAREFHPDRHFGVNSEALKAKLNSIFACVNDAYRVLSHPAERAQYDRNLSVDIHSGNTHKPQPSGADMAQGKFHEGKAALKKGLYDEAAMLFGQAVFLDSSVAGYHFYLGMTYAKRDKVHDAVKEITRAVEIEPRNADYIVELGRLYLKLGFTARAKATFEKALQADPFNRKAREGLKSA